MNKKIKLVLLTIILCMPLLVKADYSAVIKGTSVRIRTEANTSSSIIKTVSSGTQITVVDKTTIAGDGCSDGWLKIIYKEKDGYVCSKYVKYVNSAYDGLTIANWTARTTGNDIAVREGTSTSTKKLGSLSLGVNVTILEEFDGDKTSCSSGKWYKIKYNGSKTGYMCKNYIVKKEDITIDDPEYANTLREAGFPDSYIPYLSYLHSKYPNWSFKAVNTGHDFIKAVYSEEEKNGMQTTNNNYRTSTTPYEGSTWFMVNTNVIGFYMDPRNWLLENRIFMFEKEDHYEESFEEIYPNLIKSIFSNGKFADDKYVIPIMNTGKKYDINPTTIASRIRQEVGVNGSDSTSGKEFKFDGKTYSGYYNFFNIGAYNDTINGIKVNPVLRGLLYAAKVIKRSGEPWNNIETAIDEGTAFVANEYIKKGQGTAYYQKFNVSPYSTHSSFTHQYMTNIQAPATEGATTYSSYKTAGILSSSFIFEIPIYNNMPENTSLPGVGSNNNNLTALQVEGYYLSPAFDPDVIAYNAYVPLETEKVNILATAEDINAKVEGIGEVVLEENEMDVTITVTSETGVEKKYVISIKKVDDTITSSEIVAMSNLTTQNQIITKVKNDTTAGYIKNILLSSGARNVVVKSSDGNLLNDNDILTTSSIVTITTLVDTIDYSISVKGDTSGDGKITMLDLLQVLKHINGDKALVDSNLLSADTSGDGVVTMLDLLQVLKHINGDKSL